MTTSIRFRMITEKGLFPFTSGIISHLLDNFKPFLNKKFGNFSFWGIIRLQNVFEVSLIQIRGDKLLFSGATLKM